VVEEAWEHYMQAERKDLRDRRAGLLARLPGAPLPEESLAELAQEDRLRAEAGLVELRDPGGGEGVTYKPLEEPRREDRPARVAAERARASWLEERHERRAGTLAHMGGERLRFEEERGRLLAAELLEGARAQERQSIGRELHERVAHTMGVAHQSLQLYEALQASDPDRARATLVGGRLRVESAPDRGTRVAVEVPLRPRDAPRAAGSGKDSDQPDARSTKDPA
jgi:signal transduction histidine kinase